MAERQPEPDIGIDARTRARARVMALRKSATPRGDDCRNTESELGPRNDEGG